MWPDAPLVQKSDRVRNALAHPDLAQDVDEVLLILSVDLLQGDGRDRNLLQCSSTERIRDPVAQRMQKRAMITLHHRRKLEEVADHHDLDAPEWTAICPDRPQPGIDGIDQIDADHGNLVDDEAPHAPVENTEPPLIRQSIRVEEQGRELEEGMDGLRLRIQGRKGRRSDDRLLVSPWTLPQVADEPGFACAGSAHDQHDRRTRVNRGEGLAHPWRPLIRLVALKLGPLSGGLALGRQPTIALTEVPRVGQRRSGPRLADCFRLRGGAGNTRRNGSRSPCGGGAFGALWRVFLQLAPRDRAA